MKSEETTAKPLVVSSLSLSLLTVMAGAAVAPALGVIQEYFVDSSPVLVQFLCPILMSIVRMLFGSAVSHLPYCFAVVLAVFFCFWSVLIPSERATR